jgi:diketogulonate reductase-like aldo/keto reductase
MKSLADCYKLTNGVQIPCVGFGTWQMPNDNVGVAAVEAAITAGYRHIDTANSYGNEVSVGKAIKKSGIDRKELFVTTKLQNKDHGYENTLKFFEESLSNLGLDYLDLFLIHWPNPVYFRKHWQRTLAETWYAFEELYLKGRIRSIGVANFLPHHLDALLQTAHVVPHINQIRLCPGENQLATVYYSRAKDILIEAYSPLGTGLVFGVPELEEIAKKYNKTVSQVCLRWSLQKGFLPLPKSSTPARIVENTKIFDFELSDDDIKAINAVKDRGETWDPDETPW